MISYKNVYNSLVCRLFGISKFACLLAAWVDYVLNQCVLYASFTIACFITSCKLKVSPSFLLLYKEKLPSLSVFLGLQSFIHSFHSFIHFVAFVLFSVEKSEFKSRNWIFAFCFFPLFSPLFISNSFMLALSLPLFSHFFLPFLPFILFMKKKKNYILLSRFQPFYMKLCFWLSTLSSLPVFAYLTIQTNFSDSSSMRRS